MSRIEAVKAGSRHFSLCELPMLSGGTILNRERMRGLLIRIKGRWQQQVAGKLGSIRDPMSRHDSSMDVRASLVRIASHA